jgi:quinol monooxygenase YgiN
MAKLIVHHKVQDFSAWRKAFDNHDPSRREFGSTGAQVFQSAGDPNDVTAIMDWPSVDAAKAFATSASLKEAMKNAGVISQPDVTLLCSPAPGSQRLSRFHTRQDEGRHRHERAFHASIGRFCIQRDLHQQQSAHAAQSFQD